MTRTDLTALTAVITMTAICFITPVCRASGQTPDRFENWCASLRNASSPDLVQYLNGVIPDDKNAQCVTIAIRKLGKERYEPGIAILVKLLDFRRPPTEDEKRGIRERPQVSEELFPAAEALELIGKEALPEVLRAIKTDSTSPTTRDNAVAVWMEAYKYERPKGVALLKQEEIKASDDTTKQKLRWAVQKALKYCSPPIEDEGAACRQAAADSVS